jgi:hypothetical protein
MSRTVQIENLEYLGIIRAHQLIIEEIYDLNQELLCLNGRREYLENKRQSLAAIRDNLSSLLSKISGKAFKPGPSESVA